MHGKSPYASECSTPRSNNPLSLRGAAGVKTTDSRKNPRVRVMGFFLRKRQADEKPYGRDLKLDSRRPGGTAGTPSKRITDFLEMLN